MIRKIGIATLLSSCFHLIGNEEIIPLLALNSNLELVTKAVVDGEITAILTEVAPLITDTLNTSVEALIVSSKKLDLDATQWDEKFTALNLKPKDPRIDPYENWKKLWPILQTNLNDTVINLRKGLRAAASATKSAEDIRFTVTKNISFQSVEITAPIPTWPGEATNIINSVKSYIFNQVWPLLEQIMTLEDKISTLDLVTEDAAINKLKEQISKLRYKDQETADSKLLSERLKNAVELKKWANIIISLTKQLAEVNNLEAYRNLTFDHHLVVIEPSSLTAPLMRGDPAALKISGKLNTNTLVKEFQTTRAAAYERVKKRLQLNAQ